MEKREKSSSKSDYWALFQKYSLESIDIFLRSRKKKKKDGT